jgi:DNA-binding HxlR family transcriptional regulator
VLGEPVKGEGGAVKHRVERRSECPINFAFELIGDPWTMLIVRDIVYFGKRSFSEFLNSDERIARTMLSQRLDQLRDHGLLEARPHPEDGRSTIFSLTERGRDLIPLLLAAADWGFTHAPSTDAPAWWIELVRQRHDEMVALIKKTVAEGGSIFVGDNSVMSKLQPS